MVDLFYFFSVFLPLFYPEVVNRDASISDLFPCFHLIYLMKLSSASFFFQTIIPWFFFSPKVFIFHIVYKLLVFFHQPTLHTCMVTLYCNFTTRVCLPCLYPPPSYISSVHELCQPAVLMLKPEWKSRSTDGGYPLFIRRISGFVLCTLALPSKLLILTKYSVSVYHLIFLRCDV